MAQLAGELVAGLATEPDGQEYGGVLLRSFLVALVVVAPFGLWQWQKIVRRRRLGAQADEPGSPDSGKHRDGPSSTERRGSPESQGDHDSPAVLRPSSVEQVVAIIGSARSGDVGTTCTFDIPDRLTLSGKPAAPEIVDALVSDAISRSGLAVLSDRRSADGRSIQCRRTDRGTMER